jgi:serine/threonine protein kinase
MSILGCNTDKNSPVNNPNIYKICSGGSKYEIYKTNKLGEGSYSSVCLGKCIAGKIPGQLVAVKKIIKSSLSNRGLHMLTSEIEILKEITEFSHQNIVTCYDVIDDIDVVYVITEYCSDGDLSSILAKKPIKYKYVKYYFNQIIAGIKYLHEREIIHRDIKPKNILLTDDKKTIKICDFGFARRKDRIKRIYTMCGSPLYMAPEIYKQNGYNEIVDVWSLGMVLYEMIFGGHPLEYWNDPKKLEHSVTTTDIDIPKNYKKISPECIDLLQQMLKRNENDRITLEKIFEHKWLEECKKVVIEPDDDFYSIHETEINDSQLSTTASNAPVTDDSFTSDGSKMYDASPGQINYSTQSRSLGEMDIGCVFTMDDD